MLVEGRAEERGRHTRQQETNKQTLDATRLLFDVDFQTQGRTIIHSEYRISALLLLPFFFYMYTSTLLSAAGGNLVSFPFFSSFVRIPRILVAGNALRLRSSLLSPAPRIAHTPETSVVGAGAAGVGAESQGTGRRGILVMSPSQPLQVDP